MWTKSTCNKYHMEKNQPWLEKNTIGSKRSLTLLSPLATNHRAQLPTWLSPPISHQFKIQNVKNQKKYELKPRLSVLMQIKGKTDIILTDTTADEELLSNRKRMLTYKKP